MTKNYKDKDELNRIEFIISIEKGLKSIRKKEGGVVAIHASFGMGKTFFCNIYKEHLESQENHNACIIDAHLHDYVDDPFIPINQAINGFIGKEESKSKKFKKATIKLGLKVLPCAITGAATMLLPPPIVKGLGGMARKWLDPKNSLESIKKEYIEALKELTKEKQLTIFIDDLDRCRPDYALKFLERLKHYFNQVPGLLFVLMIDQDQIFSSIKHEYGAQDPHRYFEKFLSTSIINLPSKGLSILLIKTRLSNHFTDINKNKIDEDRVRLIANIFEALECNFRVQQKILNKISLISFHIHDSGFEVPYEHIVLLLLLKENKKDDIFNEIKENEQEDAYTKLDELLNIKLYELLGGSFKTCSNEDIDNEDIDFYKNFIEMTNNETHNETRKSIIKEICKDLN